MSKKSKPKNSDTNELNILYKKLDAINNSQNLFKNQIDKFSDLLENKSITDIDERKIVELELRLERQLNLLKDFEDVFISIECLVDSVPEQLDEREIFEENFYQSTSLCKKYISDFYNAKNNQISTVNENQGVSMSSGLLSANGQQSIKLPQIQLPKFSGSYESWLEFRDTFDSLINKNSSITAIQKFHYLRAALEGGAAQVIRSLEFSSSNYSVAWNALLNRYNNDSLLVHNHVKSIFNIQSLNQESAFELRKMLDILSKHLQSLESLGQPVQHWDTIIIYILCGKLDKTTAREWEEHKAKISTNALLPTLEDFKKFIKNKADLLETLSLTKNERVFKTGKSAVHASFQGNSSNKNVNNSKCVFCNDQGHFIQNCAQFLKLSVNNRIENVKKMKLCINCLRGNHFQKNCYAGHCKKCSAKHNTLLHLGSETVSEKDVEEKLQTSENQVHSGNSSCFQAAVNYKINAHVLLSTAMVQVKDLKGQYHQCRVLLDSGSQSHFISEDFCNRIGLHKTKIKMSVTGINQVNSEINYQCKVSVESLCSAWKTNLDCLVISIINESLPIKSFDVSNLNIPSNIKLADPSFSKSGRIDLIIGVTLFYNLLCVGQISLGNNLPVLQKTALGWIVSGSVSLYSKSSSTVCSHSTVDQNLHNLVQKFWEIEETLFQKPVFSDQEKICEEIFQKSTKRYADGRFIVQIPLKESSQKLGKSKGNAMNRLKGLESKFSKNSSFRKLYFEFLEEYYQLGHMSRIESDFNEAGLFLPHHGVLNEKNQTTKLRVVFDASAATDSGISLNDIQRIGPTIQNDLVNILLRFRQHAVVICGDIVKMYRQISISPEQRHLQKILWRFSPTEDIQEYELNTVTYGTASAPWLAVRCLKQLSLDFSQKYPKASAVIQNDFYMDDLLTGSETVMEAIELSDQIVAILKTGCFDLQKWASNCNEVLNHVKEIQPSAIFKIGDNERTKTLGLYWMCSVDKLMYSLGNFDINKPITKRSILSDIAQVFDPLGLVSPCIITGKIILQQLWMQRLGWDDTLPSELHTRWFNFRKDLPHLNKLEISRFVFCPGAVKREIHAFCDASCEAYGCCIYIRSISSTGNIHVNLLCSKTRVAPLKSLTIPKLELCGALLSAQLMQKVKSSITVPFESSFFWSDSTICLSWIKTQPNLLKPFVQNRVSQIQALCHPQDWYHVRTQENPADLLSRGISPRILSDVSLWWGGPSWLNKQQSEWPVVPLDVIIPIPELKKPKVASNVCTIQTCLPMNRFSKLTRLQRVTAYIRRFIFNCKTPREQRKLGPLEVAELKESLHCLVKISQKESFEKEIAALSKGKPLSCKSRLLSLNPFMDEERILRVGGRLQRSQFSFEKKHPALLSNKHYLTRLIMQHEHGKLFHCGAQQLLFSVRENFWPLSGRSLARKIVHSCIKCFRINPKSNSPIMGNLPAERVCPAPVFSASGVDYGGPITIKSKVGRGAKPMKAYICLFICLTTKCIHLELVSDLTKNCFIAAFRRFCARRGKPAKVYSDNGTTFVGANSELIELGNFLKSNQNEIRNYSAEEGVDWHFIPSYSPHMGGIWEAGIKSAKNHLKRVMANASFTFEELTTVLAEIESILNSRPITPISSDPNDLSALTPSHFLIGRSATSLPNPNLTEIPISRLSRYQYMQQIQQHFWKRWAVEFVSELQTRTKWKTTQQALKVGDLIVIKDDQMPPLQWKLGRISSLHYGKDGVARVANIQTSAGIVKRSFSKICVLPIEH